MSTLLKQSILQEARRLGFVLAGVTTPEPPQHLSAFESWLAQGRHAGMEYLATERSRARRANPREILPECRSILVLAVPYDAAAPEVSSTAEGRDPSAGDRGRVAAYAGGDDYHEVLPPRLGALVDFIEAAAGRPVPNRWYTDSGPVLERDLAQRAGLGWIGRNTSLIHPRHGSYFLLAEIFLALDLEPDPPFQTDHCGSCTRCVEACPTQCILPNRTLDAGRCISYLTIELKDEIPAELRSSVGSWIFGCDICQAVCPWNRFSEQTGDPALHGNEERYRPQLIRELELTPERFNRDFRHSPVRRAKRRGYLRNVAVALGNSAGPEAIPALEQALNDPEALVRTHAAWAIERIKARTSG